MKLTQFITLLLASSSFMVNTFASLDPEHHYQPKTYTKYEISLEREELNFIIFKVDRDEPHLNPLHFDVYFQCSNNKNFYKLTRNFGPYENELTYCSNQKPLVQTKSGKDYLSLPLMLADPETGCSSKPNREEVFNVQEIKKYCSTTLSEAPEDS